MPFAHTRLLPVGAAVLAWLGADGPARADEPPRWDTSAICARVAAADASVETRNSCRSEQTGALNEARKNWASYPVDLKRRCSEEAGLDNRPSYVELVECINLGLLNRQNSGRGSTSLRPGDDGGRK